jgi:AraC-like DNA-binding protein
VKEIACQLGYDDPFYFSRAFKAVSGFAPTDFRRLETVLRQRVAAGVLPERPARPADGFEQSPEHWRESLL